MRKKPRNTASSEDSSGSDAEVLVDDEGTKPSETPLHVTKAALRKGRNPRKVGKGKKRSSVASRTGKFADEATTQALLAASIAREDEKEVAVQHELEADGVPHKKISEQGVVSFSLSNAQRGKLNKRREKNAKKACVRK